MKIKRHFHTLLSVGIQSTVYGDFLLLLIHYWYLIREELFKLIQIQIH